MSRKWKVVFAIGIICIITGLYILLPSMSDNGSLPVDSAGTPSTVRSQNAVLHDSSNTKIEVAPDKPLESLPAPVIEYGKNHHSRATGAAIDAELDTEEETARQEASQRLAKASSSSKSNVANLLELLKVPTNKVSTEVEKALEEGIDELVALGDEVIPNIMAEFDREDQNFVFRHRAVTVLENIESEKSKEALLCIALGQTHAKHLSMKKWAANAYIRSLEDRSEASKILASEDDAVQNAGLLAIAGCPLDGKLVTRVIELLDSENYAVRWAAAKAISEDPQPTLVSEKVRKLASAISRVSTQPRADKIYPRHFYTYGEIECHKYIEALVKMPESLQVMQRLSAGVGEEPRDIIAIARALKGDASLTPDIRAILTDSKAEMKRAWAATAMGVIGSEEDVALLRTIAGNDPLIRIDPHSVSPEHERKKMYPVREAAHDAVIRLEKRLKLK